MCTDDLDGFSEDTKHTFEIDRDLEINTRLDDFTEQYATDLLLERFPSGSFDSSTSLLVPAAACSYCGNEIVSEQRCESCQRRRYCSPECREQHLTYHQPICVQYSDLNERSEKACQTDLVRDTRPPIRRDRGCRNDHWTRDYEQWKWLNITWKRQACFAWELFASVTITTRLWDVHQCENGNCRARRALLHRAAPGCEWTPFRDLVLSMYSCSTSLPGDPFIHAISQCLQWPFGKEHLRVPRFPCFDVFGIISLWRWAYRFFAGPRPNAELPRWHYKGHELRSPDITMVLRAKGLCPSRLWNLTLQSWDASVHLEQLLGVIQEFPAKSSAKISKHSQCTEQLCLHNQENTTAVQQAHKCADSACGSPYEFPIEALNEVYADSDLHTWRQSAWSTAKVGTLCPVDASFIALSHVWSDGTGVGTNGPGRINRCLFDLFAGFAEESDCQGVWWDTTCLPTGREQRRKAMNVMLQNYERAACTIIHDEDLARMEWREDGSPALALALSTWFTRGWTAAELYASRGHPIKVVFAGSDGLGYVLKDLDKDVLVNHFVEPYEMWQRFHDTPVASLTAPSALVPTLSHFVASDILRQLRPEVDDGYSGLGSVTSLHDLIRMLNARTTAWPRDKLLIAGLLCLTTFSFDSIASSVDVTRQILTQQKRISVPSLLHGSATVTTHGPWSWCPPSIFDFAQSHMSAVIGDYDEAVVTESGQLDCHGCFQITPLNQHQQLVPVALHPSVTRRILLAQSHWEKCVLLLPYLSEPGKQEVGDCVLAYPIEKVQRRRHWNSGTSHASSRIVDCLDCRWIGSVRVRLDHPRFVVKEDYGIVFGADVDDSGNPLPPMDAAPLFKRLDDDLSGSRKRLKRDAQNGRYAGSVGGRPRSVSPASESSRSSRSMERSRALSDGSRWDRRAPLGGS